MLVLLFSIPCVGGAGNILNGYYNAACILILFPIIVMMGAGSRIENQRSAKICTFLGELSYPLYMTHFPIAYIQMSWAWSHPDAPLYAHMTVFAGSFIFAIMLAFGAMKVYDIPVRRWLSEHWLKRDRL